MAMRHVGTSGVWRKGARKMLARGKLKLGTVRQRTGRRRNEALGGIPSGRLD
jgi:hypothetical protein